MSLVQKTFDRLIEDWEFELKLARATLAPLERVKPRSITTLYWQTEVAEIEARLTILRAERELAAQEAN